MRALFCRKDTLEGAQGMSKERIERICVNRKKQKMKGENIKLQMNDEGNYIIPLIGKLLLMKK